MQGFCCLLDTIVWMQKKRKNPWAKLMNQLKVEILLANGIGRDAQQIHSTSLLNRSKESFSRDKTKTQRKTNLIVKL